MYIYIFMFIRCVCACAHRGSCSHGRMSVRIREPGQQPLCVFLCMLSWLNSCSTETNYNEARLVGRGECNVFVLVHRRCSPFLLSSVRFIRGRLSTHLNHPPPTPLGTATRIAILGSTTLPMRNPVFLNEKNIGSLLKGCAGDTDTRLACEE